MQTARLPSWVELLRSSGYVFSGRVVSVHLDGKAGESTLATVSLKFRVEEPVHGVVKGQTLAVKEWAGLWASERYHVGQKVFLFLYPPSKLGLTSPVWGGMGRFAVSDGGVLQIPRTTPGGDGDNSASTRLIWMERGGSISQRALARALRALPEDQP